MEGEKGKGRGRGKEENSRIAREGGGSGEGKRERFMTGGKGAEGGEEAVGVEGGGGKEGDVRARLHVDEVFGDLPAGKDVPGLEDLVLEGGVEVELDGVALGGHRAGARARSVGFVCFLEVGEKEEDLGTGSLEVKRGDFVVCLFYHILLFYFLLN